MFRDTEKKDSRYPEFVDFLGFLPVVTEVHERRVCPHLIQWLAALGTASFAAEVHKSDDLTVSIGGNIQLMVISQNEFDVADNGSRVYFDFGGPIAGSVRGRGHFEWYVNTTAGRGLKPYQYRGSKSVGLSDDGGDVFTNRLGYFELLN